MLRVVIDGQTHELRDGISVLQALQTVGRDVPHLCHDARIKPSGACRLCIVEIDGEPRPIASCSAMLSDGMRITTNSNTLESLRKTNLSLLANHYSAPSESSTPFDQLLQRYAITPINAPANVASEKNSPLFCDDSHPYLGIDMARCISCQRCVRICDELQGQFVWANWGRGEQTHIAPTRGATLIESGCVACGACVDTCPSGALFDKRGVDKRGADKRGSAENLQWTRSTCVYCGVGCQLEVGSDSERIVAIRPADSPVNRGHACVKGRYAFDFNNADDRITTPLIKIDGEWRSVTWDQALDFTANKLRDIVARRGADSIGVLGSARGTNEENYLAQKFARVVLGTNNVDCCARVCHTPSAKALKTMLGTGAATNHFDDIEQAECILICGCNPTENHPVVGARIKQAVLRGTRLIVVDPRRIELADYADIHLAVKPGHNVELFNAIAATIIEENLVDRDFIAQRVDDFESFATFVSDYAPEKIAASCGVAAQDIRAAARLYANSNAAMCFHGLGMTEHIQGTEGVMTLINLALLTGNFGKPGCGINPLRGQNNVQGAAQMGCDPATLTGSQSIPEAGEKFAALWGAPIPATHGLDLLSMMDAAADGKFAALWSIGYDIFLSLANATATAHALQQLELVIVQDLFLNETAKEFGTVFFPAASVFEKDGTFMNADRRVQRVRRSLPPRGDSQPDAWIIQQLAQRMGHTHGFEFANAEAIWNEVRALWPAGAGLSYQRLEHESIHWPCPAETAASNMEGSGADHPGTPILHIDRFQHAVRTALARIPFIATTEQCNDEFPLLLITGRTLYQFNAGTMTGRTPNNELRRSDTLDIAPSDAARLQLHDGDTVRVTSRYGEVALPLRIVDHLQPGQVFATFHNPELFVNRLTSPHRDRLVKAPEYKVTAVRVSSAAP